MTIRVHLPKDMAKLQRELALAHAEVVQHYIKRLPCTTEQKTEIATAVIKKTTEK